MSFGCFDVHGQIITRSVSTDILIRVVFVSLQFIRGVSTGTLLVSIGVETLK